MADQAPDVLLDVLSVEDDQNNPILNNVSLQLGEHVLEFKNGRAKIPTSLAAIAVRDSRLRVPGYTGAPAPPVANAAAPLPDTADKTSGRELTAAEREERLLQAEEYLRSQGLPVPPRAPVDGGAAEPVADPRVAELEGRVNELEEMLRRAVDLRPAGDGDAPAQPLSTATVGETGEEPVLPDGFEATTTDGKPRCAAAKGDGSQCSNAAVEGSRACQIGAHQKQVSK